MEEDYSHMWKTEMSYGFKVKEKILKSSSITLACKQHTVIFKLCEFIKMPGNRTLPEAIFKHQYNCSITLMLEMLERCIWSAASLKNKILYGVIWGPKWP